MIAIHTKYIGPSNTRGARIKAYASDGRSVTVGYDHALDSDKAHFQAARAFADKHLKYTPDMSRMAYGDSADGKGYCFCFLQSVIEA